MDLTAGSLTTGSAALKSGCKFIGNDRQVFPDEIKAHLTSPKGTSEHYLNRWADKTSPLCYLQAVPKEVTGEEVAKAVPTPAPWKAGFSLTKELAGALDKVAEEHLQSVTSTQANKDAGNLSEDKHVSAESDSSEESDDEPDDPPPSGRKLQLPNFKLPAKRPAPKKAAPIEEVLEDEIPRSGELPPEDSEENAEANQTSKSQPALKTTSLTEHGEEPAEPLTQQKRTRRKRMAKGDVVSPPKKKTKTSRSVGSRELRALQTNLKTSGKKKRFSQEEVEQK